ncbi:hypothetical protein Clacol_005953 [Clathrus columnatus]|uniref:Cytochrome P450 n=1 Tax=Clathrus columnatus TaxID=1419009 RepID=A0AAV5AAQ2_9AGAM|nr:hypothetical protein Clacol_005953 [Clathrus columnatus]
MAVGYLMGKVPGFIFNPMKRLKTKSLKKMKLYMSVVMGVAQDVVDKQTALYAHGKEGSKDLMSVLVRANLSENPETKLSNEEVISQLTTFFFAGHETTSSTLVWVLYELSRHPEYQTKVRDEIKATRARITERGDGELTISDLDSMQYLTALMKETLRYHPVITLVRRQANRDDCVPLDIPITLTTGEVVTSILIERGQEIQILKSTWGEDADEWRPERFVENLDLKQQTKLGVISNMMLEMQSILIELVENFEFSPPPGDIEILRVAVGFMAPILGDRVKGSKSGRIELPLTVKPL